MRAIVRRLRRMLSDDADDPAYIFTKRNVGYWMEKEKTRGQGERLRRRGYEAVYLTQVCC